MNDRMSVLSETLVDSGKKLAGVAGEFDKALAALRTVLESIDRPWGTDEVGAPFDEAYTRLRKQADVALASYHVQVKQAARSLPAAARLVEKADEDSEADVKTRFRALWPTRPAG
jgi:hypothetical protein